MEILIPRGFLPIGTKLVILGYFEVEMMSEFDPLAEGFDTEIQIETGKIISAAIREYIIDGKEKTAIDYGCGTGLVGLELLDAFKSILFVDSSINMLEITKKKIEAIDADNADTLFADFVDEIPEGLKTDCLFMSRVLHHVIEYEPFLAQISEIINPAGHLIIVDFDEIDEDMPEQEAEIQTSPDSANAHQQSEHHKHNDQHGGDIFHDMHMGLDQTILLQIINKLPFAKAESKTFYHGKKIFRNRDASLFILHAQK